MTTYWFVSYAIGISRGGSTFGDLDFGNGFVKWEKQGDESILDIAELEKLISRDKLSRGSYVKVIIIGFHPVSEAWFTANVGIQLKL